MGQKYCVNNNSQTSEPNEFVNLINYWITGKYDRQTSEPDDYMGSCDTTFYNINKNEMIISFFGYKIKNSDNDPNIR